MFLSQRFARVDDTSPKTTPPPSASRAPTQSHQASASITPAHSPPTLAAPPLAHSSLPPSLLSLFLSSSPLSLPLSRHTLPVAFRRLAVRAFRLLFFFPLPLPLASLSLSSFLLLPFFSSFFLTRPRRALRRPSPLPSAVFVCRRSLSAALASRPPARRRVFRSLSPPCVACRRSHRRLRRVGLVLVLVCRRLSPAPCLINHPFLQPPRQRDNAGRLISTDQAIGRRHVTFGKRIERSNLRVRR